MKQFLHTCLEQVHTTAHKLAVGLLLNSVSAMLVTVHCMVSQWPGWSRPGPATGPSPGLTLTRWAGSGGGLVSGFLRGRVHMHVYCVRVCRQIPLCSPMWAACVCVGMSVCMILCVGAGLGAACGLVWFMAALGECVCLYV